jgi:transcriptional regulator with XRE-family HTH domain
MKTSDLHLQQLLKKIRENEGLTQVEFAARCGYSSDKNVSDLENGFRPTTLKTLRKVADTFGYNIEVSIFKENPQIS